MGTFKKFRQKYCKIASLSIFSKGGLLMLPSTGKDQDKGRYQRLKCRSVITTENQDHTSLSCPKCSGTDFRRL